MGEYADMAVDAGIDEYWEREQSDAEGDGSPIGAPRFRGRAPKFKTCRRCGQGGLHWAETDNGWRLHSFGEGLFGEEEEHACPDPTLSHGVAS